MKGAIHTKGALLVAFGGLAIGLLGAGIGIGVLISKAPGGGAALASTPSSSPSTAVASNEPTPASSPLLSNAALPSTASLPSDPCLWLLQSDAQDILGIAVGSGSDLSSSTGPWCIYFPVASAINTETSETSAYVSILDSAGFAAAQETDQPDTASYTITPVPSDTILPAQSAPYTGDQTFYATSVGPTGQGHYPTTTALFVCLDDHVYFSVTVVDPVSSETQIQAQDRTAAVDVLRNLNLG